MESPIPGRPKLLHNRATSGDYPVYIDSAGDLLLAVSYTQKDAVQSLYRVNSSMLRQSSPYFRTLLAPDKFLEGALLKKHHERNSPKTIPAWPVQQFELPRITIEEIDLVLPGIPADKQQKTNLDIVAVLLRVVHKQKFNPLLSLTAHEFALLANVADRLDIGSGCGDVLGRSDLPVPRLRNVPLASNSSTEVLSSRMALASLIFRSARHFATHTSLLIGMKLEARPLADESTKRWPELPDALELEIFRRRQMVFSTVESLLHYILDLYRPRKRQDRKLQCKLGYDTSARCDDFQYGRFVGFLVEKRVCSVQSLFGGEYFAATEDGDYESWGPEALIELLKQYPKSELDEHHQHCCISSNILWPRAAFLRSVFDIEARICGNCWVEDPATCRWQKDDDSFETFYFLQVMTARCLRAVTKGDIKCPNRHRMARSVFAAKSWDWSDNHGQITPKNHENHKKFLCAWGYHKRLST